MAALTSRFWTPGLGPPIDLSSSTAVDGLLLWSVTTDNVEILKLTLVNQQLPVDSLLNWRAIPTALPRRRTIAMIAAYHGASGVLAFLLSHGADPNARSPDDGYTPLHCAAEGVRPNAPQVIALLLQYGALPDVYDVAGRKPVDLLQPRLTQAQRDSVFAPASLDPDLSQDGQGSTDSGSELDKAEYQTDAFRMYEFKVTKCPRTRAHDWTECPFAHPGEKARRRNPQQFTYCGSACPDFRKGSCKRGDACQYAHGVFECWLHPSRYRTQLCKDAPTCTRRVCFFAHSLEELRQPTENPEGCGAGLGSEDAGSERGSDEPSGAGADAVESSGSSSVPPPSSPSSSVPSFATSSDGGTGFSSSSSSSEAAAAAASIHAAHSRGSGASQATTVGAQHASEAGDALAATFRDLQISTALGIARLRSQMYQNVNVGSLSSSQAPASVPPAGTLSSSMLGFNNRSASCESLDTSWINVLTSEDDAHSLAYLCNLQA